MSNFARNSSVRAVPRARHGWRARLLAAAGALLLSNLAVAGTVSIFVDPSGDNQTGSVTSLLPIPYTATNSGLVPANVIWRISSDLTGGASLELAGDVLPSATSAGIQLAPNESAGARLRLGPSAGDVIIEVCNSFDIEFFTCDVVLAEFNATAEVLPNLSLMPVSGNPVAAVQNQPFQVQVQVLSDGNPLGGQPVQVFGELPVGPGSQTIDSDPNGFVTATLSSPQAGSFPGTVEFFLDPDPGTPGDEISLIYDVDVAAAVVRTLDKPATDSGDGQSGELGAVLPLPLRALALDDGAAAAGVTVLWSTTGDAQLGTTAGPTDSTGIAETIVTLGQTPGPITIFAERSDEPTATTSFVVNALAPLQSLDKAPVSGDQQSGAPGDTLPLPLAVIARDGGIEVPGVPIGWSLRSGDASIQPAGSTTDGNGRAEATITLGQAGPVVIRATRLDSSAFVDFTLNSLANERLEIVSGDNQSGVVGSSAGTPLLVRYMRDSAPVAGVPIRFEVAEGDASIAPASAVTDGNGLAATGLSFGDTPGPVRVRASAAGVPAVVFRATALEGDGGGGDPDGATLSLVSGDGQRGPVFSTTDHPLVFELLDDDLDPVANIPVQFELLSGDAELVEVSALTDAAGRAQLSIRFGATPGPVRGRATALGDEFGVEFGAEAFLPTLVIVSGNGQTAAPGAELELPLVVAIADPGAKGLASVPIQWSVETGGGTLAAASTLTDSDGRSENRLVLGATPGPQRVVARVGESSQQVVFEATAERVPAELVKVSGDGQVLPTRSASAPLVVELRDGAGQPVAGVELAFSGDNATVSSASATTGEDGRAQVTAQVMLPGAASVAVSVVDSPDVATAFAINAGVVNTEGLDPGQREVADAIDQLCPALLELSQLGPEQQDLLARCMELVDNAGDNPDDVADALDEMINDVVLAQVNAALLTTSTQFDNLKTRIAALRSGSGGADFGGLAIAGPGGLLPLSMFPGLAEGGQDTPAIGADFGKWGVFVSGTIGRGEVEAGQLRPDYEFDTAGLTAGIDYRYSDTAVFGVALGYARQDTELGAGQGAVDTDGWSVSAYGTWFRADSWYLDGVLTWGSNDYEFERLIDYRIRAADGSTTAVSQLARADSDGSQLSGAISFGRDFQRGAWSLGPYLRATFTQVEFDAYQERLQAGLPGAGLGLEVDARDLESTTAVLGGKISYTASRDWGVLMPHLSLEWEHEFQDDPQRVETRFLHDPTGTTMSFQGEPLDRDYLNLGIGLSALFPGGRSGFIYYEHLLGADGIDQGNLAIGMRFEF